MRAVWTGVLTGAACLALWSAPAPAYERPWLGIFVTPADAPSLGPGSPRWRGGARVIGVEGPAGAAGMRVFDVVVAIDGDPIVDTQDLVCRIAAQPPGGSVRLTLVRGFRRVEVTATLGHWPDPRNAGKPPRGCRSDAISDAGRASRHAAA